MNAETKGTIEYMLLNAFHHVPAGESHNEFWWRDCILHDGDYHGTQGYLMLWFDGERLTSHHTYHYPPEIY